MAHSSGGVEWRKSCDGSMARSNFSPIGSVTGTLTALKIGVEAINLGRGGVGLYSTAKTKRDKVQIERARRKFL
jgi:hypothetical protein